MSSVITVSDVHGSTNWKNIVKNAQPDDTVIFLGDYFDLRGHGPFAKTQEGNFLEICAYMRDRPKTIMLVGNHDIDYMFDPQFPIGWNILQNKEPKFRKALLENGDILRMVYIDYKFPKPVIFSHGGLTGTFLKNSNFHSPDQINELWITHPQKFEWLANDPESGEISRGDGDNEWQPPTWVRTWALRLDGVTGYDQVVGHTPVRSPAKFFTANGDTVLLTCTLDKRHIILNHDLSLDQNTRNVVILN